jgi:hypothetical protein
MSAHSAFALLREALLEGAHHGETPQIQAWCRLTLDKLPEQWRDFRAYAAERAETELRELAALTSEAGEVFHAGHGPGFHPNCPICRDPHCRTCGECGMYADFEMEDGSRICHACGAVS